MTSEAAADALNRYAQVSNLDALQGSEMVIEAILEDKDVKVALFGQLEKLLAEDAILATNTSSISISSIARELSKAERFIGLHFFNPAHIMKLVEIIPGPKTNEQSIKKSQSFVKSLSKTGAIAKDVPGFIVNRVARHYYNEAQRIVTEGGAQLEQVDRIMKSAGFKMGPFELMDLIGVDVNLEVTKSMYRQYFFEPRFQPSTMQQHYVDAGLHGKKTGRGFYDYSEKA